MASENDDVLDTVIDSSLPRVVVKFQDWLQPPYEDGIERLADRYGLGPWAELLRRYPRASLKRLYRSHSPSHLRELTQTAANADPTYKPVNLAAYFYLDAPGADDWNGLRMNYASGRRCKRPMSTAPARTRW
ncbi:MAG TPA: hypothetical protein VIW24_28410 [Aldersonia sp.]